MALTTTFATNPVKTIIVNQTASTSNAGIGDNNVSGGPAYLHTVEVDNSALAADVYVKLFDSASATAGTDTATLVLFVKDSTTRTFQFFPGLQFENGVTLVTTTTAGQAGTTAPATPPAVTMVLSETAS